MTTGSRDPLYKSTDWQRIRKRQLSREPMCRACGRPADRVDHIKPISKGGARRDPANLQSLCVPCHNRKTAMEMAGKTWTIPGCFEDGSPRDPSHPWHTGGDAEPIGRGGYITKSAAIGARRE